MCFYVVCGFMSLGCSKGGLLFDVVVEEEEVILCDSLCLI